MLGTRGPKAPKHHAEIADMSMCIYILCCFRSPVLPGASLGQECRGFFVREDDVVDWIWTMLEVLGVVVDVGWEEELCQIVRLYIVSEFRALAVLTLVPVEALRGLDASDLFRLVSLINAVTIELYIHTSLGGPSSCPRLMTVYSDLDNELPATYVRPLFHFLFHTFISSPSILVLLIMNVPPGDLGEPLSLALSFPLFDLNGGLPYELGEDDEAGELAATTTDCFRLGIGMEEDIAATLRGYR